MNQYRCENCKNQDDCTEWKYTSVRDVSVRCGLICHSDFQSERDKVLTEKRIDYLRSLGWMVAVHNDYKQNGEFHTFWLLTYPDGKYLKGEGKTDEEALKQIVEELRQSKQDGE